MVCDCHPCKLDTCGMLHATFALILFWASVQFSRHTTYSCYNMATLMSEIPGSSHSSVVRVVKAGQGLRTKPTTTCSSSWCNLTAFPLTMHLLTFQDWMCWVSSEELPVMYWCVRSRVGSMQVRLHGICLSKCVSQGGFFLVTHDKYIRVCMGFWFTVLYWLMVFPHKM